MTNDLVNWLRYCAPERRDCSRNELAMLDAADHIEKLEKALRDIMNERGICLTCGQLAEGEGWGVVHCNFPISKFERGCCWSAQNATDVARVALGEENNDSTR